MGDRDKVDGRSFNRDLDGLRTEAEDIHFFYVLPLSTRRALIETTYFSTQVLMKRLTRRKSEITCSNASD